MKKKIAIGAAITGAVAAIGTAAYMKKEVIQSKFHEVKDNHFKKEDDEITIDTPAVEVEEIAEVEEVVEDELQ